MDLIDREALHKEFRENIKYRGTIAGLAQCINDAPTVTDVAPVVHGHWIYLGESDGHKMFECSACKSHIYGAANYCKECGAKMDEEVK